MSTQTTRHFINGAYTEGTSGRTFENRQPIDNALISQVYEAGRADVDTAVQAARAALNGPLEPADNWPKRTEVLYAVAAGIMSNVLIGFLEAEVADTGKPVNLASHIDIPRGAANFRIFADVVKKRIRRTLRHAPPRTVPER